ncbi:MAG: DUF72 domain-containing protein [Myxococcales bacterium]|nr:DUF72 domain-containing protein [Myxococcales bacterium]MDH3484766.1 DUF72 domain-containing protein [Myxococcales bacterium]
MRIRAGTSGFSYKEWKGPFYPEKLPANEMLGYYAERLSTVEINNTFYRMPKPSMLEGWVAKVPEDFVFVLKASRKITHSGRLKDVGDSVDYLWSVAGTLGPHLGPILFQLPPFLKKDVERLRDFMGILPDGMRAAFEFRHESWFDDDTYTALRKGGHTLCLADTEKIELPEIVSTTDWGYLRLRREDYSDQALRAWKAAIVAQSWDEAFVFFKHEDEGAAPRLAKRLLTLD